MEQFFIDFAKAISPALQILISALAVTLAGQASAWLIKQSKIQTAKLSKEQQYLLELLVSSGVRAAEQMYQDSTTKRDYVFKLVDDALANSGITINSDAIWNAIEAEVYSQFTAEKIYQLSNAKTTQV